LDQSARDASARLLHEGSPSERRCNNANDQVTMKKTGADLAVMHTA
jgi:hypothetical protein